MSENQEVNIRIFKLYDMWRYEIKSGKRTYLGSGNDFDDAEKRAFEKAKDFKGTIHIWYEGGKAVEPVTGTFADALVNEGFKKVLDDPKTQKVLDKLGSDYDAEGKAYWDKWDNDFGNP
jgi:hypothetical protein